MNTAESSLPRVILSDGFTCPHSTLTMQETSGTGSYLASSQLLVLEHLARPGALHLRKRDVSCIRTLTSNLEFLPGCLKYLNLLLSSHLFQFAAAVLYICLPCEWNASVVEGATCFLDNLQPFKPVLSFCTNWYYAVLQYTIYTKLYQIKHTTRVI